MVTSEAVTILSCGTELRELWRKKGSTLPGQWREQYPALFDDDDLRLAEGPQRRNHFCEWFAAIHLYHRDGSRSLIEKFDTYENHRLNHRSRGHRRKVGEYERLVPEDQRQVLHDICVTFGVQLPDLFVISADGVSFSFAEVKGPSDGTLNKANQRGSRDAIRDRLGVPVEIIKVRLAPSLDG